MPATEAEAVEPPVGSRADFFGSDVSEAMLRYARERYANGLGERFTLASGSVTALPFADSAFDCVISMRLLHHFGERAARVQALQELSRVSGRFLVVSLWTDGNFKAWRRSRLERRRGRRAYQNRFVVPRAVLEGEFRQCGLTPLAHFDLIPGYSQWRFYLLKKKAFR
jgi:ubiquinone/menaquinone biosynthesis C-methylase UbiE